MTKMAAENLSKCAQQKAAQGHLFDETYINALIKRIDIAGVGSRRRVQVISMLQDHNREPLTQWTSRIDRVSNISCVTTPRPSGSSRSRNADSQADSPCPTTSKLLSIDGRYPLTNEDNRDQVVNFPSSSSDSSGSDASSTEDDDVNCQPQKPVPRAYKRKSEGNLRVYGTSRPKAPFKPTLAQRAARPKTHTCGYLAVRPTRQSRSTSLGLCQPRLPYL
jgi:hypothetical protein